MAGYPENNKGVTSHGYVEKRRRNVRLMKEKLYTPVVGDILDQMGYKHQFLPASIRPLAAQVPTAPYILPGETEDKRLKVAGYACTVLENDVFEYPRISRLAI